MSLINIPEVRLTFDQYFFTAWRFTLKAKPVMWVVFLPALPVSAFIYNLVSGSLPVQALLSVESIMFWLMLGSITLIPYQMWQQFNKQPLLHCLTSYELSETGFRVNNVAQQTRVNWTAVKQAYTFGRWLILLTAEQHGYFLDLHHVTQPNTKNDVLVLLRQSGVTFK